MNRETVAWQGPRGELTVSGSGKLNAPSDAAVCSTKLKVGPRRLRKIVTAFKPRRPPALRAIEVEAVDQQLQTCGAAVEGAWSLTDPT